MRRFLVSIGATLLVGAFSGSVVFAQSPALKAARQTVEKTEAPVETFESYQTTLLSVLDLTKAELDDALGEKKISSVVSRADVGLSATAKAMQQQLRMYTEYVALVRKQVVRKSQTLDDLKTIATSFKAWREQVYEPSVRVAFDTLLVAQSADVVSIAQRRLELVNTDVKKLQNSKGAKANDLVPLFESAHDHIAKAVQYYEQSRDALTSEYQDVAAQAPTTIPGSLHVAVLARGPKGDFVCGPGVMPLARGSASCALAFKTSQGAYYALYTQSGEAFAAATGDIAQVSGTLLTLSTTFPDDAITGIFFIDTINRAAPEVSRLHVPSVVAGTANALETIDDSVLQKPNIQSLTKQVIDEVTQAYKDFLAMSKKAQQLLAR